MPADHPDASTMSLGDHLDELRKRLLLAVAAPLPLFILIFTIGSDWLVTTLLRPVISVMVYHGIKPELIVLSPPELLLTKLKLSIIGAVVISAPWILYQAWQFVVPGLYQHERRFVYFLIPGSAILTTAGIALLYFVMLPLMLHVLVLFAQGVEIPVDAPERPAAVVEALADESDVPLRTQAPADPQPGERWVLVPEYTLQVAVRDPDDEQAIVIHDVTAHQSGRVAQPFRVSYVINFVLLLLLGIVIAFQMPLVITLLGWMGLIGPETLRANRKYAVLLCTVIAAVITPADAVSLLAMLVPLYGLYELGIVFLRFAPAARVAEGSFLRVRSPDKVAKSPGHAPEVAQPESVVPRSEASSDRPTDGTDDSRGP